MGYFNGLNMIVILRIALNRTLIQCQAGELSN